MSEPTNERACRWLIGYAKECDRIARAVPAYSDYFRRKGELALKTAREHYGLAPEPRERV